MSQSGIRPPDPRELLRKSAVAHRPCVARAGLLFGGHDGTEKAVLAQGLPGAIFRAAS